MKDKVLADTSVWVEFFKAKSETGNRLEILLKENSVWTCGVVTFELLQGVRSASEKPLILETLSGLPYIEMTQALWQKSAELSGSLRKEGYNLPLSDILIAALAIEHNLKVFSLDSHFEQIPNLHLYKK